MHMNIRKHSILLICMLTLAGPLLISCQQEEETPPVAIDPVGDSVASADGVMIHYEVVGEGEPTLVFVHGWSCDRSYWKNQVDEFAETYQVVTIDMGGHGESGLGREDWTLAAFGADVAAVVNKLNPAKVVLIGHSMAGAVIIQAAHQLPGRVIGLIGADTYKVLKGRIRRNGWPVLRLHSELILLPPRMVSFGICSRRTLIALWSTGLQLI